MISLRASCSKYFDESKGVDPFNSVMYCNYLYNISHLCYVAGKINVSEKIYYLNKMLNSVDIYPAVELPKIWTCEHPLGTVLGRAKYGNYFLFYQGCTVGGNHKNYPVIGEYVTMFSNSKILGKCNVGNNVILSANSYVKDTDIPNNSIVFGQFPDLVIKENKNIDKFWK